MSNRKNITRQAPDWKAARRFLAALTGKANPKITVQVFDDAGDNPKLAGWRHGTLKELSPWLVRKSSQGCGIYLTINRCDGFGRSRENVVECRAVAADLDGAPLPSKYHVPPEIIVESSKGKFHLYWLVKPTTDVVEWSDAQACVAHAYKGDPKIFDPPRVLRIPGFDHLKGDPFRVRLIRCNPQPFALRRSISELMEAHPSDYPKPREHDDADSKTASVELDGEEAIQRGKDYAEGAPVSVEGDGGNNNAYRVMARLSDFGLSPEMSVEILTDGEDSWNARCLPPWDEDELARIAKNAAKYRHDPPGFDNPEAIAQEFGDLRDEDDGKESKTSRLVPTPYIFRDPSKKPPRQWIYKPFYIRRYLSLTAAPGGTGKSGLSRVEAVAMATGLPLLGIRPVEPVRVWCWNGEDPLEEIERSFDAIMRHYSIDPKALDGRLFFDSGRLLPIKIATIQNGAAKIAKPVVKEMLYAFRHYKIDVLQVDPFVASHSVAENSNDDMEMVAKKWGHIADEANGSVAISHHTRKTMNGTGTIEDSRGASAVKDAARVRRALNKMTEKQATDAGINPDQRGFYFSLDSSLSSLTPPASALDWYRLQSVDLGNATDKLPADTVGVPTRFAYTKVSDVQTTDDEDDSIFDAIAARDDWRDNPQADSWVGRPIAAGLCIDVTGDSGKGNRKRVRKIIADWLEAGVLEKYEKKDGTGHTRAFIRAGTRPEPVTRHHGDDSSDD